MSTATSETPTIHRFILVCDVAQKDVGRFLQALEGVKNQAAQQEAAVKAADQRERDRLRGRIERYIRLLASTFYLGDFPEGQLRIRLSQACAKARNQEIEVPFGDTFDTILNTWSPNRLQEIADHLEAQWEAQVDQH
jgi:hypothetical protein